MSSPPSKRRRTSSPRQLVGDSAVAAAEVEVEDAPPRRARSPAPPLQPELGRKKNPLEGFNDEEEPDHQLATVAGGPLPQSRAAAPGLQDEEHDYRVKEEEEEDEEEEEEHCAICLSPIENRAVVSPCHHGQFCWGCIRAWTDQSRKCPLCLGPIEHLIHNIRSAKDYQNHYLLPLHSVIAAPDLAVDAFPPAPAAAAAIHRRHGTRVNATLPRHALYGPRRSRFSSSHRVEDDDRDEATWREREQERALERRRYIYREGLYAKHVASNRYTGFKPFTPDTFSKNAQLKAKVIKFIRREASPRTSRWSGTRALPARAQSKRAQADLLPSTPPQLQVFPAVDVAFLTTYLVSIASQLDLRSPSAIRLISDFLSEQDAQHLVHEISTFARSPFTSLEGYDRFVQYGRPQCRELVPSNDEDQMDREEAFPPRFEEHMRRERPRGWGEQQDSIRSGGHHRAAQSDFPARNRGYGPRRSQEGTFSPAASSRSLPPRAAGGAPRRYSSGQLAHVPPRPPRHQSGRSRPPIEPDWRERDQRYTGSYYVASESRRDHVRIGGRRCGGPPPAPSRSEREEGRRRALEVAPQDRGRDYDFNLESGARSRWRSPSLCASAPAPPMKRRRRSSSPTRPSPPRHHLEEEDCPTSNWRRRNSAHSDRDASPPPPRPRSRAEYRRDLRSSRSDEEETTRSSSPPRRPTHERERARSRSRTPSRRGSLTPPPPPADVAAAPVDAALDSELDDAISLVGPTFSIGPRSRETTPASPLTATDGPRFTSASLSGLHNGPSSSSLSVAARFPTWNPSEGKATRPTLAIFGAARRLLGNGRVVTLSKDGRRASLQPPPSQRDVPAENRTSAPSWRGAEERAARPRQQVPYVRAPPNRSRPATAAAPPATPAWTTATAAPRTSLLDRLGGIASPTFSTISSAPVSPRSSEPVAAATTNDGAHSSADSLRARLQARLTAEYRQALAASRSNTDAAAVPTTSSATTAAETKSDLRSLLQARLQAEKALAYEDLVRSRAAASLANARTPAHSAPAAADMGFDGPTVFSQATRDLLMARLEEERILVREEAGTTFYRTYEYDNGSPGGNYDLGPGDVATASAEGNVLAPATASSSPATKPVRKTESSLRAALLAKRQATIQGELKKRTGELQEKMMRRKLLEKRQSSGGSGGGADAGAVGDEM